MAITREQLVARKAELEQSKAQLEQGLAQAKANYNAHEGAIADCEHWLSLLDAQEAAPSTTNQQ